METTPYAGLDIVVVTGLSGAGRTTAMHCLEDMGFFCVDNLPAKLIPLFANLCGSTEGRISKAALAIDVRERHFFEDVFTALDELVASGFDYRVLFLEASDGSLIRRYSATRRTHPLAGEGEAVAEGISREREMISRLRERATWIVDTSNLTEHDLKSRLKEEMGEKLGLGEESKWPLTVHVTSFGFKYGVPMDSDMVLDVRFLPNPNYVKELKPLTGTNEQVSRFVLEREETKEFLHKIFDLLAYLLPQYTKEGKVYLTIGVGCTGGRHRSVALAERIGQFLREKQYVAQVRHRDVTK